MTTAEWTEGDPLYREEAHPNSNYLYNWRDSSDGPVCNCQDAARWPNPGSCWDLGYGDEFARFITEATA